MYLYSLKLSVSLFFSPSWSLILFQYYSLNYSLKIHCYQTSTNVFRIKQSTIAANNNLYLSVLAQLSLSLAVVNIVLCCNSSFRLQSSLADQSIESAGMSLLKICLFSGSQCSWSQTWLSIALQLQLQLQHLALTCQLQLECALQQQWLHVHQITTMQVLVLLFNLVLWCAFNIMIQLCPHTSTWETFWINRTQMLLGNCFSLACYSSGVTCVMYSFTLSQSQLVLAAIRINVIKVNTIVVKFPNLIKLRFTHKTV